jgi:hypothetical protein
MAADDGHSRWCDSWLPIAQVAALLAGVPERCDWKKCAASPAEEEARTGSFKALFKAFDIMQ